VRVFLALDLSVPVACEQRGELAREVMSSLV